MMKSMSCENGKIYRIKSHKTDQVYIGSTTLPLSSRFSKHKSDYKRYLNGNFNFVSSFEILKYSDAFIELVEDYPCENKSELRKREGLLTLQSTNCVNKHIAGRTEQEYKKEYLEQNKDKINAKFVCDCGGRYTYRHKSRHLKSKKHLDYISTITDDTQAMQQTTLEHLSI